MGNCNEVPNKQKRGNLAQSAWLISGSVWRFDRRQKGNYLQNGARCHSALWENRQKLRERAIQKSGPKQVPVISHVSHRKRRKNASWRRRLRCKKIHGNTCCLKRHLRRGTPHKSGFCPSGRSLLP